ncbi:hypothetical protein TUM17382_04380 [Shewanella algae]|nr:hypothetical protein TUM17382_04380 [Shewanella algae]
MLLITKFYRQQYFDSYWNKCQGSGVVKKIYNFIICLNTIVAILFLCGWVGCEQAFTCLQPVSGLAKQLIESIID